MRPIIYKYPEMQQEWLTTANVTLFLFWFITVLLIAFTIYVIFRMWREWSRQSRVLGCGGLAVLVALVGLIANEIDGETFISHFLPEYVAAVSIFVVGLFAVEQFLEMQRSRAISAHYLPAITHEILYNCRALAKSLGLVKATLEEGYEVMMELGKPSFRCRHTAWSSFMVSGHSPTLPARRNGHFCTPIEFLAGVGKQLAEICRFKIEDQLDYESAIGWSETFATDIERAYELLRDAELRMEQVSLVNISGRYVGFAATTAFHNPSTEEERAFKESFTSANAFCKVAVETLEAIAQPSVRQS